MRINKYIKRPTVASFLILFCSLSELFMAGCNDFLEEKDIPGITSDFYTTKQGVEAAVDATYSYMRFGVGGEITNILTELGTDLTTGADGALSYATNQYNASLNADLSVFNSYWSNCYKAINVTNVVIASVPMIDELNDSEKTSYIAEMSFFRAYFYFDLVQQFGDIPLRIAPEEVPRTDYTRETVANVYKQIITDLRFATDNLSEIPALTGKATKYAASHLLAKVYLTRASAVTDQRGQQTTDADSALYYSEKVINSGRYSLQSNFSSLWDAQNYGNSEVIFSLQFTTDLVYNGSGNLSHLYWASYYEDCPGMMRDIENGRPYRFHRATNKVMFELYDRKNDSRFYKSFKWVYYCNKATSTLAIGDTAIYYSLNPKKTNRTYLYTYYKWDKDVPNNNNKHYPPLIKYFDPNRAAVNDAKGSREWVRMRLGETYLIAAEAAGRTGDFDKAATYINIIRQRAAWHDGETKMPQYWVEEGGIKNDTNSTYPDIKVTASQISTNFVDFMLDERGRELLGEYNRWEDLVRCEKLYEYVTKYNPDAAPNIKEYHKLRPIPQKQIDVLSPKQPIEKTQNLGYY